MRHFDNDGYSSAVVSLSLSHSYLFAIVNFLATFLMQGEGCIVCVFCVLWSSPTDSSTYFEIVSEIVPYPIFILTYVKMSEINKCAYHNETRSNQRASPKAIEVTESYIYAYIMAHLSVLVYM